MFDDNWIKTQARYPLVVIGSASVDFRRAYEGKIDKIKDIEELREFVAYYSNIKTLNRPVVIDDLSFLPGASEGVLLKFLEETQLKVIVLSTYDKLSPVILSRVRMVIKYYRDKVTSEFLKPYDGIRKLDEQVQSDTHYFTKIGLMGKTSPILYYLDNVIKGGRNKSKFLTILEG